MTRLHNSIVPTTSTLHNMHDFSHVSSEFQNTLFKMCEAIIKVSTPYLHEADGQTKCTNRTIEDMLQMYVGMRQQPNDK